MNLSTRVIASTGALALLGTVGASVALASIPKPVDAVPSATPSVVAAPSNTTIVKTASTATKPSKPATPAPSPSTDSTCDIDLPQQWLPVLEYSQRLRGDSVQDVSPSGVVWATSKEGDSVTSYQTPTLLGRRVVAREAAKIGVVRQAGEWAVWNVMPMNSGPMGTAIRMQRANGVGAQVTLETKPLSTFHVVGSKVYWLADSNGRLALIEYDVMTRQREELRTLGYPGTAGVVNARFLHNGVFIGEINQGSSQPMFFSFDGKKGNVPEDLTADALNHSAVDGTLLYYPRPGGIGVWDTVTEQAQKGLATGRTVLRIDSVSKRWITWTALDNGEHYITSPKNANALLLMDSGSTAPLFLNGYVTMSMKSLSSAPMYSCTK